MGLRTPLKSAIIQALMSPTLAHVYCGSLNQAKKVVKIIDSFDKTRRYQVIQAIPDDLKKQLTGDSKARILVVIFEKEKMYEGSRLIKTA